jgi:hypothetical protein
MERPKLAVRYAVSSLFTARFLLEEAGAPEEAIAAVNRALNAVSFSRAEENAQGRRSRVKHPSIRLDQRGGRRRSK